MSPPATKKTTIIPVPKKNKLSCLNVYFPVALTSIAMKYFETLVLGYIKDIILDSLDTLQFAYHHKRSIEDAISHTRHTTLAHLENKNCYARLLFVDDSLAFNTATPSKLDLGLGATLCN